MIRCSAQLCVSFGGRCSSVSVESPVWQTFYYNMDIVLVSSGDESIADVYLDRLFVYGVHLCNKRVKESCQISNLLWLPKETY